MTAFTVVIPARYASTRLPGKPLLDLAGKTMLQRVYEQACLSDAQRVLIATDDARIQACAAAFDAPVVMTSPDHESGTDRLQEVVTSEGFDDDTIVVNVQGDEPLIPPAVINQVARNLDGCDAAMATLCEPISDSDELFDPNAVKVVMNAHNLAMYFSRAPIPWQQGAFSLADNRAPDLTANAWHRHIGIYAYRVGFLHEFVAFGPCQLEQLERLEQLRALWHGKGIHCALAEETPPAGIDTPEDLERVRQLLCADQA